MKNIILRVLFMIGMLTVYPQMLPAQNGIRSTGSVALNTIGIDARYEQHLEGNLTILITGGFRGYYALGWVKNNRLEDPIIIPFALEARYYYNPGHRLRLGKSIEYNAADFISAEFTPLFKSMMSDYMSRYDYIISPTWGLSRVYGKHWLLEVATGINLYIGEGYTAFGPKLNVRFGLIF